MDFKDVLLAIPSPRDLKLPVESFDEIDYVDKLWVKYMPMFEAYDTIRNFFLGHKYQVLIIVPDDLILPYFSVAQIIHDLRRHSEIQILSGVCNLGSPTKTTFVKKMKIVAANLLQAGRSMTIFNEAFDDHYPLHRINVAFKPVVSSERESIRTLSQYRFPCAHVIFDEERIRRVSFQGFSLGAIRREVVERVAFRSYQGKGARFDVSFALDCQSAGIEMYADYNVVLPHHQHYDKILVGKQPAHTKFEPRRRELDY